MPRIIFLGAGSTVFARKLLADIFFYPELANCDIVLEDINIKRLHTTEEIARQVARIRGANPHINITTNLKEALNGADYVINMIQVGGYQPSTVIDFEIPKKYGLRQTIWESTLSILNNLEAEPQDNLDKVLRDIPVMPSIRDGIIISEFRGSEQIRLSNEYAPQIIHSIETGQPRIIYGNVLNKGRISNLPNDCIVEM